MRQKKRRASHSDVITSNASESEVNVRPDMSYASMIAETISESKDQKLYLCEIYDGIIKKYPFFKNERETWKNSIRHNLTQNPVFEKIPSSGCRNLWGLAQGFEYHTSKGRLVRLNRPEPVNHCHLSLPEVQNLLEATSNPKLILPRLKRPFPGNPSHYLHQSELSLDAPPWVDISISDEASFFSTGSSEVPLKVELFRRIDKEFSFTPPIILPKVPIYPFFTQMQPSPDNEIQAPKCTKKLRRNSDPLLSNPGWMNPTNF